jgi:2-alkyl-3-oxoalkanoate reductase
MPGTVVVTGANGFVGAQVLRDLVARGAQVRAVVRRAGSAPTLAGVEEAVGHFADPGFAASVVGGASSVVTTVHPMGSDRETQHRVGVLGTRALADAAAGAGVERFIHISTAAVYDRSPGVGDVEERSALVGDDANDYAFTKRDADVSLAEVEGITRVLLRPPAILGGGPTSTWNTLRPDAMREDSSARRANPTGSFPWVHVTDLASLAADLALGAVSGARDADDGPEDGGCVAANVVASTGRLRDYYGTVTDALGLPPVWTDEPVWTGDLLGERARRWGWSPQVDLAEALAEVARGLAGG